MRSQADAAAVARRRSGAGRARCLEVGDARLRVHMAGSGAPVVLVHGWAMDHRVFRPQRALAARFRVVTYNRRGFGGSTGVPDPARELDDLDAVADAVIGGPFHLLGMSQGGRIAVRYAISRPRRLRSLLLQGAAVDGDEPAGPAEERIPVREFAELARRGRLDEVRRRWLRHPMMQLGPEHAGARRLVRQMLDDYDGRDLLQLQPQPQTAPLASTRRVLQSLAATRLPVLLLTGVGETVARRQTARRVLDTVPLAREAVFARSGHLSNLTEPAAYNAAVLTFLEGIDTSRPDARTPSDGSAGD